jgi:hypothetical protein
VTVDAREAVLTYPTSPSPLTVDCRLRELIYPSSPAPSRDDTKDAVLTYVTAKLSIVDCKERELM